MQDKKKAWRDCIHCSEVRENERSEARNLKISEITKKNFLGMGGVRGAKLLANVVDFRSARKLGDPMNVYPGCKFFSL